MDKVKALEGIIDALKQFMIPAMSPDKFDELSRGLEDLRQHYDRNLNASAGTTPNGGSL